MKTSIGLFAFAVSGVIGFNANVAVADIGLANPGQQGSLLIFPRIAVQNGYDTIVRIANNSQFATRIKCYWVEQGAVNVREQSPTYPDFKEARDFAFDLTRNQSVWFNARNGQGTVNVSPFPYEWGNNGELICFATNSIDSVEIPRNYLSGVAEVYNTYTGDTHKYSAYAFYRNALVAAQDGMLELNFSFAGGTIIGEHDSCSEFMVANFAPEGALNTIEGVNGPVDIEIKSNYLNWAGCTQNLAYETGKAEWINYDVTFEVWNSDEAKFTGAFERGDSTWEVNLAELDRNGLYFTVDRLGTDTGYFRARDDEGKGLLGVLTTATSLVYEGDGPSSDYDYTHATTTVGAGRADGVIMYVPGRGFPAFPEAPQQ